MKINMQILKHRFVILFGAVFSSSALLYTKLSFVSYCCGLLCPLYFILSGAVILAFGFLLFSIFLLFKHPTKINAASVLILLAAFIFFFSIDIKTLQKQIFLSHLNLYQEYANAVHTAKLDRDSYSAQNITLPDKYKSLSVCDVSIVVDKEKQKHSTFIFFYKIIDWYSFSGFLYSSNTELPDSFFQDSMYSIKKICAEKIQPNWYYCQYDD